MALFLHRLWADSAHSTAPESSEGHVPMADNAPTSIGGNAWCSLLDVGHSDGPSEAVPGTYKVNVVECWCWVEGSFVYVSKERFF